MISSLSSTFKKLNARERALVTFLFAVVLPSAAYFLVAAPMIESRGRALERLSEARAEYDWVLSRHQEWISSRGEGGEKADGAIQPVGLSGIERALTEIGFRDKVVMLQNDDSGRISLRLDPVLFVEAARFLDQLQPSLGYKIDIMTISAGPSAGLVSVAVNLLPTTPG